MRKYLALLAVCAAQAHAASFVDGAINGGVSVVAGAGTLNLPWNTSVASTAKASGDVKSSADSDRHGDDVTGSASIGAHGAVSGTGNFVAGVAGFANGAYEVQSGTFFSAPLVPSVP